MSLKTNIMLYRVLNYLSDMKKSVPVGMLFFVSALRYLFVNFLKYISDKAQRINTNTKCR